MASYDWGTGRIQEAVQKTGYADFWELYKRNNLPGETKNYVPEILAAIIIANHPTQYGFDDVTLDPPLLTDTVTINYSVDLRLVSDIVDAPVDELTALNPSLLRAVTPPDAPFDLHLPAGAATLFEQRIATVPEAKRNSWRYHRVAAEDTLASVARQFHVSESALADANQLRASDSLQGVEALAIPLAPVAAASSRMVLYTARRGDTLVTIADRFGVSLTQLRAWNRMNGIRVEPGRRLHVAEPAGAAHAARNRRKAETEAEENAAASAPARGSARKRGAPSSKKQTSRSSKSSKQSRAHTAAPAAKKRPASKQPTHKKSSAR
jgi:membrane-bound lytic murein transglycosylase D